MNNKYITPVIVVALVGAVGAISFFAGARFGTFNRDIMANAVESDVRMFHYGRPGMMVKGMMEDKHAGSGEITAKEGNTITVKRPNGLTEKIIITGDTDITKTNQSTIDDLQIGDKVMVFGKDENGEISAEAIEINPLTRKWIFE